MKIKTDTHAIQTLITDLKMEFEGKAYSEQTLENIQDDIEHALVTYTKEDVEEERFLNLNVEQKREEQSLLRLFIQEDVHVTASLGLKEVDGFKKIGEVESIHVHQ